MVANWMALPVEIFAMVLNSLDMETVRRLCLAHSTLNALVVDIMKPQAALRLLQSSEQACIANHADPSSAEEDCECDSHRRVRHLRRAHEMALAISARPPSSLLQRVSAMHVDVPRVHPWGEYGFHGPFVVPDVHILEDILEIAMHLPQLRELHIEFSGVGGHIGAVWLHNAEEEVGRHIVKLVDACSRRHISVDVVGM